MGRSTTWREWSAQEVGEWIQSLPNLTKFGPVFVEYAVTGEMLASLDESDLQDELRINSRMIRSRIMKEIQALLSSKKAAAPKQVAIRSADKNTMKEGHEIPVLPEGKQYHYFGSHKKDHSLYSDSSESLAMRIKDILEGQNGLKGWFDLDDLCDISAEGIDRGIQASGCVLVFLNDETMLSKWCVYEWEQAKSHNIPIICVVDIDKFILRTLISQYIAAGYGYLFASQCLSYSSAHRKACYSMVATAIEKAVAKSAAMPKESEQKQQKTEKTPAADFESNSKSKPAEGIGEEDAASIHATNMHIEVAQEQLKVLISSKYATTDSFFDEMKSPKSGNIGRKDFKKVMTKLVLPMDDATRKELRKRISKGEKFITLQHLTQFMGTENAETNIEHASSLVSSDGAAADSLCPIPGDVPQLPQPFHPRDGPLKALIAALIQNDDAPTSKSNQGHIKVSSQGMGGVGKTIITAASVRDQRVRRHFECIGWCSLGQAPNVYDALSRFYTHLCGEPVPERAGGSIDVMFQFLQKLCRGRVFLVVADDVWDASLDSNLSFLDESSKSRLLYSTRIRGLVPGASEIQLSLLSLEEAVSMLVTMADIEADPRLAYVCHLAGRLPLTLGLCAGMIKRFGSDWKSQLVELLEEDRIGALDDEAEGGLSPSELIVARSVNELPSDDAKDMFMLLGLIPEDMAVPLDVVVLIWRSYRTIGEKTTRRIALNVARSVEHLLRYNLLLGSADEGYMMHDIVRDFSRAMANEADGTGREMLQQGVISIFFRSRPATGWRLTKGSSASARRVGLYVVRAIAHHVTEALGSVPSALSDKATNVATEWLTTAIDPSAMITDIISRKICSAVGSAGLKNLAERHQAANQHMKAAQLYTCASLAGWDEEWLPSTVAKHLFLAASILQEHISADNMAGRTLEASVRVLSGLQIQLDTSQAGASADNIDRIKALENMGVGVVARPGEVRLANFVAAEFADGAFLHSCILELENQLHTNSDDQSRQDCILHCACRTVKLKFLNPEPLYRFECCCCDCNGSFKYAETQGGPKFGHPAADMIYMENSVEVLAGHQSIAFCRLNQNYPMTRLITKCCSTVLLSDASGYLGRALVVYNMFGNIKGLRNVMPQGCRGFYNDLTTEQLRFLRSQKEDSEFQYGAFKSKPAGEFYAGMKESFSAVPGVREGGETVKNLIEQLGVTTLNWTPINGNKHHAYYLDPALGQKKLDFVSEQVKQLDEAEARAAEAIIQADKHA